MVCDFVEAVRICLREGGFAHRSNDVETGGFFLVGAEGRLFSIKDDYQVSEFNRGYHAIGCAAAYALGSLYGSRHLPPEERVRHAVETAEHFSGGVRAPFAIRRTGEGQAAAEPVPPVIPDRVAA